MTIPQIEAGNIVRLTVVFTPDTGTVALADVTARVIDHKTNTPTNLTPVAGATNTFYADVTVPDTAATGAWQGRFESNPPSPKITIEDDTLKFHVIGSRFPTP